MDIERAFRKQGRRKGPEGIKTNWTPAMVRPDHVIIYAMLVSLGLYSVLYWSMRNLLYHTYGDSKLNYEDIYLLLLPSQGCSVERGR